MSTQIKKRQRKPKTELKKQLDQIRKVSPSHVVEVELDVLDFQH
ncbi:hypothetical protein [Bacillus taeanensis]|nr:hypothetical protein [Bacillus taeanensis]